MTGIYRVAAVFLVVLLTGCSRGVQEASSGIEGAVSSNVLQERMMIWRMERRKTPERRGRP